MYKNTWRTKNLVSSLLKVVLRLHSREVFFHKSRETFPKWSKRHGQVGNFKTKYQLNNLNFLIGTYLNLYKFHGITVHIAISICVKYTFPKCLQQNISTYTRIWSKNTEFPHTHFYEINSLENKAYLLKTWNYISLWHSQIYLSFNYATKVFEGALFHYINKMCVI